MLTMLPNTVKERVLSEYKRVLKKGGILLTHDIAIIDNEDKVVEKLSNAVNISVSPMIIENWTKILNNNGFNIVEQKMGKLTLLNPLGLIKDEGLLTTIKIVFNGLKKKIEINF